MSAISISRFFNSKLNFDSSCKDSKIIASGQILITLQQSINKCRYPNVDQMNTCVDLNLFSLVKKIVLFEQIENRTKFDRAYSFGVCSSFFSIDRILMHLARRAIIVRMAPRNETIPKTTSTINQFLKLPILSPKSQLQFSLSLRFNAEKFTGLREISLKSSWTWRLVVEFCDFFMNL